MTNRRVTVSALLCAALAGGCAAAPAGSTPDSSSPDLTPRPATAAVTTPAPTRITLGDVAMELEPGTWDWVSERFGVAFPPIQFIVPEGWSVNGRFVWRGPIELELPPVAMQFWDVGDVYGHPCKWRGTLFDPGPSVDDLADALVDIPLRHATKATEVMIDGYAGKYFEWSVPGDLHFADCDADEGDGTHYFESWSGDQGGWGGDRYHQGPGQLDRIWILDVNGVRFVIDAFSMPTATDAEIEELLAVVGSLTFED